MKSKHLPLLDPNTVVLLKHIGAGLLVIAIACLLTAGAWYGSRLEAVTIDKIQVSGGKTIKHDEVRVLVEQELEGQYLGFIPRRFVWFYPESDILESLHTIERIHDVSIDNIRGTELAVSFDEYVPSALWCDVVDGDDCLFLDEDAYAFAESPKLSGGSFLRFVLVDEEAVLGQNVTTTKIFDELLILSELLLEKGWSISHVELDKVGDAYLKIVGGGELKVTVSQTPTEIVDNLQVILSSDEFGHIAPGNFQYIDLRFGNKVYVNEEDIMLEENLTEESGTSTALEEEE